MSEDATNGPPIKICKLKFLIQAEPAAMMPQQVINLGWSTGKRKAEKPHGDVLLQIVINSEGAILLVHM